MIESVGMAAAIVLPFWNIPLIVRISRRQSSRDVSLWWTCGVMGCLLLMLPAGLATADPVFKVFTIMNTVFFSAVTVQVVRYRERHAG